MCATSCVILWVTCWETNMSDQMKSDVKLIEVKKGRCEICFEEYNLVGISYRAKVIRFCLKCLFGVGSAIMKLKESEDGESGV